MLLSLHLVPFLIVVAPPESAHSTISNFICAGAREGFRYINSIIFISLGGVD